MPRKPANAPATPAEPPRTGRTPKKTASPKRPGWSMVFLATLRKTGNVSTACEKAKVGRSTAYDYRAAHADFRRAWEEALEVGIDAIEEALRETAQLAPVGTPGAVTAAIFLLKCRRPEIYNPPERREHSGIVGVAEIDLTDEQAAQMIRLANQRLAPE